MPKGNSRGQNTYGTQSRKGVSHAAERIREFVKKSPEEKLNSLLHHVTPETLTKAFYALKPKAAAGVDGVTWEAYKVGLDARLCDLHDRVHKGRFRAQPVRRVEIPKPDGGIRPLGIISIEDKIVQRCVVDVILTPIYEAKFLGFSYGFRPERGAHDALDALAYCLEKRKVNWIVDADIRGFFDNVDRGLLIEFLERRIGDRRVVRLIAKWLNADVMTGTKLSDTMTGTPQGAVMTP